MPLMECTFFSEVLGMTSEFNAIIPPHTVSISDFTLNPDRKYQTLLLLHDYGGNHTDWVKKASFERLAVENNLAVVMPNLAKSFYLDMAGEKYWTYISEEIPRVMKTLLPLSWEREDNFVAGAGLGGYGAFKLALKKPECFSTAVSLSGALDLITGIGKMACSYQIAEPLHKYLYKGVSTVNSSETDLTFMMRKAKYGSGCIPKLMMYCRQDDLFFNENERFKLQANKLDIDCNLFVEQGMDNWTFWSKNIKKAIEWLPLKRTHVLT